MADHVFNAHKTSMQRRHFIVHQQQYSLNHMALVEALYHVVELSSDIMNAYNFDICDF